MTTRPDRRQRFAEEAQRQRELAAAFAEAIAPAFTTEPSGFDLPTNPQPEENDK